MAAPLNPIAYGSSIPALITHACTHHGYRITLRSPANAKRLRSQLYGYMRKFNTELVVREFRQYSLRVVGSELIIALPNEDPIGRAIAASLQADTTPEEYAELMANAQAALVYSQQRKEDQEGREEPQGTVEKALRQSVQGPQSIPESISPEDIFPIQKS